MVQSNSRTYRCQVTLTVGTEVTGYMVTKCDAGWRFDKADGVGYSVGVITDARDGSRRLGCACPGHRTHGHCKHVDWLHLFTEANEVANLQRELRRFDAELSEESHLLDQATNALATLRESVESSNPYHKTADYYPTEFALNSAAPPVAHPVVMTIGKARKARSRKAVRS